MICILEIKGFFLSVYQKSPPLPSPDDAAPKIMHECRQIEEQVPNLGSKDVNGKGNVEDEKVMILRAVCLPLV